MIRIKKIFHTWNLKLNRIWSDGADAPTTCREKRPARERISAFFYTNRGAFLFILVMGCLLFGLSWILPFNEAPDEAMRYLIPQYIYKYGKLPKGWEEEVRNEIWGISYAFQPYIPYIIGGYLMKLVAIFNDSEKALLMTARFVNIVIGMGFYWYVVQIAGKLIHSKLFRTFFVALLALLPQLLYLFTYVNTDGIALFSSAMLVYYWLVGLERKWDRRSCTGLAVGVGICALSYFNAYGYALFSVVLFVSSLIVFYRRRGAKECTSIILKRGIFITVIVLLIAGWWFVRAAILFDGDILGMNTSAKYGEMYAMEEYRPSEKLSLAEQGVPLSTMLQSRADGGMDWCELTYRSTIGVFGYAKYMMGLDLYEIHKKLFLLGCVGTMLQAVVYVWGRFSFRYCKKQEKKSKKGQRSRNGLLLGICKHAEKPQLRFTNCQISGMNFCILQFSLVCCMIIPVILAVYYSYASDFQAQGRYLMPMILPLMYFTATGMERFMTLFLRKWFLYPMMLLMFYAVLHVFLGAFVSLYIPTFVESCAAWADIRFPWFANINILMKLLQSLIPG